MNEKTELEKELEDVLKASRDMGEEEKANFVGTLAVIHNNFQQMITGEWSETYKTKTYNLRQENRATAHDFLYGMLWGLEAAGIISEIVRREYTDRLAKEKHDASDADFRETYGEAADESGVKRE